MRWCVGQIVVGGVSLSFMVVCCLVDADASCSLYIVLLCRLSLRLFLLVSLPVCRSASLVVPARGQVAHG